jgi:hypothetical protein
MVDYIPILTTVFATIFFIHLYQHARSKPQAQHLLWWTVGIATYGLGTLTESINAIWGWQLWNFKLWYIMGALLGGIPLAQGSVYLLLSKKFGNTTSLIIVATILIAAISVLLSPVSFPPDFDQRLSGKVLTWQWVRYFSPIINLYAFIFLFGGAIYSAFQYRKSEEQRNRFLGNIFIAIGALLPGIGGSFTRFGYVEVLYVTELLGLLAMYQGYQIIKKDSSKSIYQVQNI